MFLIYYPYRLMTSKFYTTVFKFYLRQRQALKHLLPHAEDAGLNAQKDFSAFPTSSLTSGHTKRFIKERGLSDVYGRSASIFYNHNSASEGAFSKNWLILE